jgi:hypothetical protein
MRRAWILLMSVGLVAGGLGCSKTCQHTAGVCDCDPPPVESILRPYAGTTPTAVPGSAGIATVPSAPATMPKVSDK